MIYTSIVLFLGFSIFAFSEFGGTKALGLLMSASLFITNFSNLILLPCLLVTFEHGKDETHRQILASALRRRLSRRRRRLRA